MFTKFALLYKGRRLLGGNYDEKHGLILNEDAMVIWYAPSFKHAERVRKELNVPGNYEHPSSPFHSDDVEVVGFNAIIETV